MRCGIVLIVLCLRSLQANEENSINGNEEDIKKLRFLDGVRRSHELKPQTKPQQHRQDDIFTAPLYVLRGDNNAMRNPEETSPPETLFSTKLKDNFSQQSNMVLGNKKELHLRSRKSESDFSNVEREFNDRKLSERSSLYTNRTRKVFNDSHVSEQRIRGNDNIYNITYFLNPVHLIYRHNMEANNRKFVKIKYKMLYSRRKPCSSIRNMFGELQVLCTSLADQDKTLHQEASEDYFQSKGNKGKPPLEATSHDENMLLSRRKTSEPLLLRSLIAGPLTYKKEEDFTVSKKVQENYQNILKYSLNSPKEWKNSIPGRDNILKSNASRLNKNRFVKMNVSFADILDNSITFESDDIHKREVRDTKHRDQDESDDKTTGTTTKATLKRRSKNTRRRKQNTQDSTRKSKQGSNVTENINGSFSALSHSSGNGSDTAVIDESGGVEMRCAVVASVAGAILAAHSVRTVGHQVYRGYKELSTPHDINHPAENFLGKLSGGATKSITNLFGVSKKAQKKIVHFNQVVGDKTWDGIKEFLTPHIFGDIRAFFRLFRKKKKRQIIIRYLPGLLQYGGNTNIGYSSIPGQLVPSLPVGSATLSLFYKQNYYTNINNMFIPPKGLYIKGHGYIPNFPLDTSSKTIRTKFDISPQVYVPNMEEHIPKLLQKYSTIVQSLSLMYFVLVPLIPVSVNPEKSMSGMELYALYPWNPDEDNDSANPLIIFTYRINTKFNIYDPNSLLLYFIKEPLVPTMLKPIVFNLLDQNVITAARQNITFPSKVTSFFVLSPPNLENTNKPNLNDPNRFVPGGSLPNKPLIVYTFEQNTQLPENLPLIAYLQFITITYSTQFSRPVQEQNMQYI